MPTWQIVCFVAAHVANIIIYNNIFKYLKSHLSILIFKKSMSKKKKMKRLIERKNIYYFL